MAEKISVEGIAGQVEGILDGYSNRATEKLNAIVARSAKSFLSLTRATAPRGSVPHPGREHYHTQLAIRRETAPNGVCSYLWYVGKPGYRLTHLLEHGHRTVNGGFVAGTHFIENAKNEVFPELIESAKKALAEE